MSLNLPDTIEEVVDLLQLVPHPEGGFFREIYRSGVPPMSSRGQTAVDGVAPHQLVTTAGRDDRRSDVRRNALTSIYWMPTRKSPQLPIISNLSCHVHYYHGGLPFEYLTYDPQTKKLEKTILGPNLKAGHQLQVIVEGGVWKTGRLVLDYAAQPDYCLVGEGVAPGFDVLDMDVITAERLAELPEEARKEFQAFANVEDLQFDSHYDDGATTEQRVKERV